MVTIKIKNKIDVFESKDKNSIIEKVNTPEILLSFPENINSKLDLVLYCDEVKNKLYDSLLNYYSF